MNASDRTNPLRKKQDEKIARAIESARDWWHTEQRYYKEHYAHFWKNGIKAGIAITIPRPFEGVVFLSYIGFGLHFQEQKRINEVELRWLRSTWKNREKLGILFYDGSDVTIMLCSINEAVNPSSDLWGVWYGFITGS